LGTALLTVATIFVWGILMIAVGSGLEEMLVRLRNARRRSRA
jgi:hypothetical protein